MSDIHWSLLADLAAVIYSERAKASKDPPESYNVWLKTLPSSDD